MNWSEEDFNVLLKTNANIRVQGTKKAVEDVKIKKTSKYRNKKTRVNGVCFDSIKESLYFRELQTKLLMCREILGFVLQPKFLLQGGNDDTHPIYYIADFLIINNDGTSEIWDVKASETYTTDVYKIKKKMFMARYPGLKIVEKY